MNSGLGAIGAGGGICGFIALILVGVQILVTGWGYSNLIGLHNTQQSSIASLTSTVNLLQTTQENLISEVDVLEEGLAVVESTLSSCGVAEDQCPWVTNVFFNDTGNLYTNMTEDTTYVDTASDNLLITNFMRIGSWVSFSFRSLSTFSVERTQLRPVESAASIAGTLPANVSASVYAPVSFAVITFIMHATCIGDGGLGSIVTPFYAELYHSSGDSMLLTMEQLNYSALGENLVVFSEACTLMVEVSGDFTYNIDDVLSDDSDIQLPKPIPEGIVMEFDRHLGLSDTRYTNHVTFRSRLTSRKLDDYVHIRIEQRPGHKMITLVQMPEGYLHIWETKDLLNLMKKKLKTNGSLIRHPVFGKSMHLHGDQRQGIAKLLIMYGVDETMIEIHDP
jgi:translation initiation factor SUI1